MIDAPSPFPSARYVIYYRPRVYLLDPAPGNLPLGWHALCSKNHRRDLRRPVTASADARLGPLTFDKG